MVCRSYTCFIAIILYLLISQTLTAVTYQWEGKAGESPFSLDVPETWRTWESVKRNGVIAQFRGNAATIEVRSFSSKDALTVSQIVNQKAARLASQYSSVRLLEEHASKFKEDLHIAVWEIRSHGRLYREETAIVVSGSGPVVVSCLTPFSEYTTYRTQCDNAFYSLVLDAEPRGSSKPQKISALVVELQKIYFVNVPGGLPVITPDVLFKSNTKPTAPAQYDENYILPDSRSMNVFPLPQHETKIAQLKITVIKEKNFE